MNGLIFGRKDSRRKGTAGRASGLEVDKSDNVARIAQLEHLLLAACEDGIFVYGTDARYDPATGELIILRAKDQTKAIAAGDAAPEEGIVERFAICIYDRDNFEQALDEDQPYIRFRVGTAEQGRWVKFVGAGWLAPGHWHYGSLIQLPNPASVALDPMQAARLMDLGRMSAVVGHELKQPLSTISFAAENGRLMLVGATDTKSQKALQKFDRILDQVDRARDISNRMMEQSRTQTSDEMQFDLGQSIRIVQDLCRQDAQEANIQICDAIMPGAVRIIGMAPGMMEQIIQNTFQNAIDAIHAARKNGIASRGRIETIAQILPDGRLSLKVIDDGIGIAPADSSKAFDAFFTTKAETGGTGLGLFVCHQMIERMGGQITIGPNPDSRGACLAVLLPANRIDISPQHHDMRR